MDIRLRTTVYTCGLLLLYYAQSSILLTVTRVFSAVRGALLAVHVALPAVHAASLAVHVALLAVHAVLRGISGHTRGFIDRTRGVYAIHVALCQRTWRYFRSCTVFYFNIYFSFVTQVSPPPPRSCARFPVAQGVGGY